MTITFNVSLEASLFGVDADHERNGPYRSVYARRIITRGPRATSSRFQVIFLPLLEFGKTCLAEVPDRPSSPLFWPVVG
ncbi:hypothetical protein J1614_007071 [Plenodomus biglobosus]|nr:hypothetical protein J1614_007071 [Plenodomus biglobosus]